MSNFMHSIASSYSRKISEVIWNKLYRSRRLRILSTDTEILQYILLIINLSITLEKKNYDTNTRRIALPPQFLYLISDPNYEHYNIFFDSTGAKIRNWIFVPLKQFIIDSTPIKNKNNDNLTCQLAFYPLTDGMQVYGFDVWTYQWFWGGVGEDRICPAQASEAMRETLKNLQEYKGIGEKIRIIKMANNSLPPTSDHDKQLVKNYTDFCHKIFNF
jgi:hypothetical protein